MADNGNASIHVDDLPPEVRKRLGLRKTRVSEFSKNNVREYALRCLAPLAALTPQQRARVLQHATKLNRV